ncbi:MAG: Lrp/AsnC ligand binding domain-containing protein [Nitrosotalea sp.]
MINCEIGSEAEVIEELKSIYYIKEVQGVLGIYDILAKLETPSIEHMRDAIAIIRKIKDILCTTTVVCTKSF